MLTGGALRAILNQICSAPPSQDSSPSTSHPARNSTSFLSVLANLTLKHTNKTLRLEGCWGESHQHIIESHARSRIETLNLESRGTFSKRVLGRGKNSNGRTNENIKTLHSFHSFIWSLGFCRPDDYYIHNFCCSFRVVVERALLMLKCLSSSPFLYVASVSFLRPRTNFARNSPNSSRQDREGTHARTSHFLKGRGASNYF